MVANDFGRCGDIAARRAYGGVEQAKQAHREERAPVWLQQILLDLRYGLRTLNRSPGLTITAVYRQLQSSECGSHPLPSLWRSWPARLFLHAHSGYNLAPEDFGPAYGDFFDIKGENHTLRSITEFEQAMFNLAGPGSAQHASVALVDGDFPLHSKLQPKLRFSASSEACCGLRDGVGVLWAHCGKDTEDHEVEGVWISSGAHTLFTRTKTCRRPSISARGRWFRAL
jgi:hypothetical protein